MTKPELDISPALLRSFLAVVETRSFTAAGQQLGLGQSTISQHILRLENALGRRLIQRDTHSLSMTGDGDAMVEFARTVLEANARMERFFAEQVDRTNLRIGISEDFAMSGLSEVLSNFSSREPNVNLELTVGLSEVLYQRFDAGQLDVILAKRRPDDNRGRLAWKDELVWIGRQGLHLDPSEPVPLIAYAPPSITRSQAILALEEAQRNWRVACSSGSLNGLVAALRSGLGVAAHARRLIPAGLAPIPASAGLPVLPSTEFVAIGPGPGDSPATRMVDLLVDLRATLQRVSPAT
jgi:DNA-binding transcriptional LysR family regulator